MLTRRFFRSDDLLPEENETVQLALKRLSPKEAYDRVFRMRRAFQVRPHTETSRGQWKAVEKQWLTMDPCSARSLTNCYHQASGPSLARYASVTLHIIAYGTTRSAPTTLPSSHITQSRTNAVFVMQDYTYLSPIIRDIEAELTEREDLESMVIKKRKSAPKKESAGH